MKKSSLYAFFALVGALFVAGTLWAFEPQEKAGRLPTEEVTIETAAGDSHIFTLEIAEKPIDKQVGLMHRKEMPRDHGMIFLMGKPARVVSFWMKNTYLPLDMLFVDEEGRIAHIHHNATPLSLTGIGSQVPVVAVIELNGGEAAARGIRIGDHVDYSYFK